MRKRGHPENSPPRVKVDNNSKSARKEDATASWSRRVRVVVVPLLVVLGVLCIGAGVALLKRQSSVTHATANRRHAAREAARFAEHPPGQQATSPPAQASEGGQPTASADTDKSATDAAGADVDEHAGGDAMSSDETCDFTFTSECEVCGRVDDCLCTVEAVNEFNTEHFFPKLRALVTRPFFRFFYVNLYGECKAWADDDGLCTSPNCAVQTCEDTAPFASFETAPAVVSFSNYSCLDLNAINDTVTASQLSVLQSEQRRDTLDRSNFCVPDELVFPQEEMQWVNLLDNPERYTGYSGPAARRIWDAVYSSNCFRTQSEHDFYQDLFGGDPSSATAGGWEDASQAPDGMAGDGAAGPTTTDTASAGGLDVDLDTLCLEERFFYRLLSGVHASISVHLSYKWLDQETGKFRPNITEFRRRFSDSTTGGRGTRWLKNLYFTYLTVLKAIVKAENLWHSYAFSSGDAREDAETKAMVLALVDQAHHYCDLGVDDEALFQTPDRREVLEEMREHLRQVTEIMNCVGCQKCRLWGKLQTRGLATAVRLLLGSKIGEDQVAFELGRNDIVALFNLWERLASSITYMHEFQAFPPSSSSSSTSSS